MKNAEEFFGKGAQIAIGCIGISYLLPDSVVKQIAQFTYALCAPGSELAVTGFEVTLPKKVGEAAAKEDFAAQIGRMIRAPVYPRSPQELAQLIQPWRVIEQNRLEDWLDMKGFAAPKVKTEDTLNIDMYGVVATR